MIIWYYENVTTIILRLQYYQERGRDVYSLKMNQ